MILTAGALPHIVRGEQSECISPLTTLRTKYAWQAWEVSRSEAFHLLDAVDLARERSDRCRGGVQGRRSLL